MTKAKHLTFGHSNPIKVTAVAHTPHTQKRNGKVSACW